MGIKRTAKASDYKRAMSELNKRGGAIEGTPNSILISLGFDGSWNEFKAQVNAFVFKTELGRYAVKLSNPADTPQDAHRTLSSVNPKVFAMCASTFILGEGEISDFESFTGEYESLKEVILPLASEVDSSISGLYLPYKSDDDIVLYAVERGILYNATGDGLFTIYGSAVLAHSNI